MLNPITVSRFSLSDGRLGHLSRALLSHYWGLPPGRLTQLGKISQTFPWGPAYEAQTEYFLLATCQWKNLKINHKMQRGKHADIQTRKLKKKGKHIYYNIIKVITNNPTKENLWSFLLLIVYWNVFALSLSLFFNRDSFTTK